ncbi:hypothetical protein [Mycolicibacterium rhodesiae]|uniref:Transmembrane protein n=1 Tax=Mycolicibacterium rhodesiae TaxID=36814 RepID=A0A1X0ITG0_MYCRH|nr:hypothetical protein [Mycolicibacterium rhodesiae]ORB51300.1 hypothetical protein BST42_17960 [Mycolicibacterium rhodesiae]
MAADTNVTNQEPPVERPTPQPEASAEASTAEPPAEPTPAPPPKQRTWSMPKSPITRKQLDDVGRAALKAVTGIARFVAAVARNTALALTKLWRAIEAVPAAVQLFGAAGIGMLVGIVGAITVHSTAGLVCTVVVIPVCAAILGALGHRWYCGLGIDATERVTPAQPTQSDLQRSVEYVDKKLALALNAFGTEQHQQAVIALFQAKTAVELTLGTEQDPPSHVDLSLRADDYALRPRIRAGSTSALPESNSLAAS